MKKCFFIFCVCFFLFHTLFHQSNSAPDDPVNIPDDALRAFIETKLGKSSGDTITEGDMNGMTGSFNAPSKGITDLTGLEHATGITSLTLSHNKNIADLSPLEGLTGLTGLYLRDNKIVDISPLAGLTALTALQLSDNQITDISSLRNLTNLTSLVLSNNRELSDISIVKRLTKLETLRFGVTNITHEGLSEVLPSLSALNKLDIQVSPITDLSVLEKLPSSVILNTLDLRLMGPYSQRGWHLKDLTPLVSLMNAGRLLSTATRELILIWNFRLDYESHYIDIPALKAGTTGFLYSERVTPKLERVSPENHVGRPGTTHTFVVRASNITVLNIGGTDREFLNPVYEKVPVTFTVTAPDGSETVTETVTTNTGLARVSIRLGVHDEIHTVDAVVPAKQNTNGPSHDELKVSFTATADRNAPIPEGVDVTFEGYPETPPTDEFNLTIIFSEPVTGFQMQDLTVETALKTGTGAAPSFEEADVPIETAPGIATLKALTPVEGPEQTYTATIGLPDDAIGTVKLIVHAGAALGSTSGQVGPPTDTPSEPIEFRQPKSLPSNEGAPLFPPKIALDKVIFNEIRNASDDKNDWIELKNTSDKEVSLTDWEISIVTESAPKMISNTADLRKEDVDIVIFPEDYTLPAGGILLIVNTHPSETDLIEGQEITDEENDPHTLPQYLIASEMRLPDVSYLLILRSARDKNGEARAFEDLAGNYFQGFDAYGTSDFPLLHTARSAVPGAMVLTLGQAWQRVDVEKPGYTEKAWAPSGHQSGLGYKPGSALETSLGTPGYPNDIVADSLAGRITFSEVMYATRGGLVSSLPQWIELYNNTAMAAKPLDLEGWRLVIEARDSEIHHRYSVIELQELSIATAQTVLFVTRDRRHSGHLTEGQVYNLFRHDSSRLKLGLRENTVLPVGGFSLKLFAPDGTLVDSAGNLDGKTGIDNPTWELPSGYTEDGERTSLIRRYEDSGALVGTDARSWVRSADVELPLKLYYGYETDIGSPGHKEGGVAPVMLSHFRASRTEADVIVEWATVSETDTAGFNILRGQRKTGSFVKVNPALILGGGTTADKQSYTYRDTRAEVNVPYYYRLEEVSLSGEHRVVATVRLRGHLSAIGKLLWKWVDVKIAD